MLCREVFLLSQSVTCVCRKLRKVGKRRMKNIRARVRKKKGLIKKPSGENRKANPFFPSATARTLFFIANELQRGRLRKTREDQRPTGQGSSALEEDREGGRTVFLFFPLEFFRG